MRKLLLVQFNSNMLTQNEDPRAKTYYDKLYRTRPGYHRFGPTWEIPKWMAEVAFNFPEADVMFADSLYDVYAAMPSYDLLAFSALDCSKHLIREVSYEFEDYKPSGCIAVGGYVSKDYFDDLRYQNVYWFNSIEEMCKEFDADYKPGVDYRHFAGAETIARLTMSTGCSNRCKFCTVPSAITEVSERQIMQQAASILNLESPLVYIDDKTFGQAGNRRHLKTVYKFFKWHKPDFNGFIIQTTASQLLKFDDDFLVKSGIRYVELGVESHNDEILQAMHKPASEKTIQAAVDKLKRLGIKVIPNIMIGLPGEDEYTYTDTISWLYSNIAAISHVNVYTYVDYGKAETTDENRGGDNELDKSFAAAVYDFGMLVLDRG